MWLKLTHCRWCESERWGWEVSTDEGIRERGRRVLTWVAAAFTGLYLAHKPLFDPAGDGFPCVGLRMSRDHG